MKLEKIDPYPNIISNKAYANFLIESANIVSKVYEIDITYADINEFTVALVGRPNSYNIFRKSKYSFPFVGRSIIIEKNEKLMNDYSLKLEKFLKFKYEHFQESKNLADFIYLRYNISNHKKKDEIDILKDILQQKQRNQARKAIKDGVKIQECKVYSFELYKIYVQCLKEIGMFPHSIKLFKSYLQNFENIKLFALLYQGKLIGYFSIIISSDVLFLQNLFVLKKYKKLNAVTFAYLKIFETALACDCSIVDFGRSIKDSGNAKFKANFSNEYYLTSEDKSIVKNEFIRKLRRLLAIEFLPIFIRFIPMKIFIKLCFVRRFIP